MDNSKGENNKSTGQNPSSDLSAAVVAAVDGDAAVVVSPANPLRHQSIIRTPFTNLSQEEADLALARTLQEQERAYMMLRMNGEGSDYESWEAGSYYHEDDEDIDDASSDENDDPGLEGDDNTDNDIDDTEDDDDDDDDDDEEEEEDAFDVHAHEEAEADVGVELDPASFPNDEAYARALQDVEDREMAARLLALAGLNEREDEEMDDHSDNSQSQDTWDEVDPDEMSYEELLALGEVVGTESRGLSAGAIASLPSVSYNKQKAQDASNDSCVICRLDYEDDDTLTVLSCKHSYHSECINNWLRINKVCPVCSTEVSASGNS